MDILKTKVPGRKCVGVRFKSTLTKRGLRVKTSGYKVNCPFPFDYKFCRLKCLASKLYNENQPEIRKRFESLEIENNYKSGQTPNRKLNFQGSS